MNCFRRPTPTHHTESVTDEYFSPVKRAGKLQGVEHEPHLAIPLRASQCV